MQSTRGTARGETKRTVLRAGLEDRARRNPVGDGPEGERGGHELRVPPSPAAGAAPLLRILRGCVDRGEERANAWRSSGLCIRKHRGRMESEPARTAGPGRAGEAWPRTANGCEGGAAAGAGDGAGRSAGVMLFSDRIVASSTPQACRVGCRGR